MSLYTSMTTAISGLTAQSRALGNVADNVANSQTIGFKRTDTAFVDYVTRSTQRLNLPGSVMARPDYQNSVQGTLQQTDNPLAIAIAGQGFFSVAQQRGTQDGLPVFDETPLYTRAGDFSMDRDGFLVNGQGYFLQAWRMDATGNPDRTQLTAMRVDQTVYNPVATSRIELSANLPADNTAAPAVAQAQVYDALGRVHTLDLTWTNLGANRWRLDVNAPDDTAAAARGSIEMLFGDAATPPVADGTLGSFANATGSLAGSAAVANGPARVTFDANFGQGTQAVSLDLGTIGVSDGMTQYAGREISVRTLNQNGVPLGAFSGVSMAENGDISINYDNGQIRTVGRVPIASFRDPDRLQRVDGQAFQRTQESGGALIGDPASLGIGKLVTNTVEGSNVDIASEFSKLILAQRAYTANTKIVTATDELLQDTLNMRR